MSASDADTLVSVGDFAAHLPGGPYSKPYAHQLKKNGRLVMHEDGKSCYLQASLQRVKETADPSKSGVAQRHAKNRKAKLGPDDDITAALDDAALSGTQYDYQREKAKREHWAARREEMSYRKEAGDLLEATEFVAAMADFGGMVRVKLEAWATLLPVQLVGRDESEMRAAIAEQVEGILGEMAAALAKHERSSDAGAPAQHEKEGRYGPN